MNIKSISANIGKAMLINALFMLISVVISIIYNFDSGFAPLLISCLVTALVGFFPLIFSQGERHDSLKDGYVTIVLTWVLSFIFGMLPYVLWGGEFTLINAWFESVSGYTTTGSTILTDIEALPHSLLFWRSSTHFIGGLGVIVFLLLILPESSHMKRRLSQLELSLDTKNSFRHKGSKVTRIILSIYIGLTVTETLCLWAAGMSLFDAVNHAFSTVATGGFSTRNASIMHYDSPAINIIIMVFMTLSAMHFGVIFAIFAQRSLRPLMQSVTRYYLTVIAVISIMIAFSLTFNGGYESFGKAMMASSFQTISFLTTTGFGQCDNAEWPILANVLLIFASIHCGCSGSTTGGIKADRIYIAGKGLAREFRLKLSPSSVIRIKSGNTYISDEAISAVFLYIVIYILVIFFSFTALLICGTEMGDAFTGTVASLGNVGPGMGSLGTMGNYSMQSDIAKIIYTADMFLGRVEIIPILIVISMIFKKNRL